MRFEARVTVPVLSGVMSAVIIERYSGPAGAAPRAASMGSHSMEGQSLGKAEVMADWVEGLGGGGVGWGWGTGGGGEGEGARLAR